MVTTTTTTPLLLDFRILPSVLFVIRNIAPESRRELRLNAVVVLNNVNGRF